MEFYDQKKQYSYSFQGDLEKITSEKSILNLFEIETKSRERQLPDSNEIQKTLQWHKKIRDGSIESFNSYYEENNFINGFDYDFRTPLHTACKFGKFQAVAWLVQKGADMKLIDRFGNMPFQYAMQQKNFEIMNFLNNQETDSLQLFRAKQNVPSFQKISLDVHKVHKASEDQIFESIEKSKAHLPHQKSYPVLPPTKLSTWNIFENQFEHQAKQIFILLIQENVLNSQLIASELDYYFNKLGFDKIYFMLFTIPQIAKHIHSYIMAKRIADIKGNKEDIFVKLEDSCSAFYLTSEDNISKAEQQIEEYINYINTDKAFYLISVKSNYSAVQKGTTSLYVYYVTIENYENPELTNSYDLYQTCTPGFLKTRNFKEDIERHKKILQQMQFKLYLTNIKQYRENSQLPVFLFDQLHNMDILMWGINQGRDNDIFHFSYLQELTQICYFAGVLVLKKFIETFSNGIVIYTIYTTNLTEQEKEQICRDANLIFVLPKNIPLIDLFFQDRGNSENNQVKSSISSSQLLYFYCAAIFTYFFIKENFELYSELYENLKIFPEQQKLLQQFKTGIVGENIKTAVIFQYIKDNLIIFKQLYAEFKIRIQKLQVDPHSQSKAYIFQEYSKHEKEFLKNISNSSDKSPLQPKGKFNPSKLEIQEPIFLHDEIKKSQDSQFKNILRSFMKFNESILKTNFYQDEKAAISFRLDPKIFMDKKDYVEIPFGVFLIIGQEFQGFHVRFRDIARGGIRLIKYNPQKNLKNQQTQFLENYNLAYTQMLKNKDILESGSKGTILMLKNQNHMSKKAFMSYIDSMLDLLLLNREKVEYFDKSEEIIFLGPDENTANLMDAACFHAQYRGYKFWKAFSTGKSQLLGGIPHDEFGMTTRGVQQYIKGIQKQLNLNPEQCTKIITGGPDGDLGSNEIKMGKEKLIAIIDGSGVLYDPLGIDKKSIITLAEIRKPVSYFNGPLSEQGYLIKCTDQNITLPDGTLIMEGESFRNNFHLKQDIEADFFVPCGGRPEYC